MHEKKPLTKNNLNFINEPINQNERLNEELSQLKSTLKNKNKASKQSKSTTVRFYLNDKTTRLV
ncbi:Integrase protein family protein, partial (plasmid) [Borrelia nietonii YOR]